jgi:hypothetical protein
VVTAEGALVLSLSGWITEECLGLLLRALDSEPACIALDLKGVGLVAREAVQSLAAREASGIELLNCPAYVREWITWERRRSNPDSQRPRQ